MNTEKPIKNDRFIDAETDSFKARMDAKIALELALLNTQLIDILASKIDSNTREERIAELREKHLLAIHAVSSKLRTDYLARLRKRSSHITNFQLLESTLDSESSNVESNILAKVSNVLTPSTDEDKKDIAVIVLPIEGIKASATPIENSNISVSATSATVITPSKVTAEVIAEGASGVDL